MSRRPGRWLIWVGLFVLCAVMLLSCMQESAGFDQFHEITCSADPLPRCVPTGRRVLVTRKPGDRLARPPKLAALRIEIFSAEKLLETHLDQIGCTMPDVNNFACRQLLGAVVTAGAGAEMAPWRMVQGRLINDGMNNELVHYLNGLELWRNRLTFGNFER